MNHKGNKYLQGLGAAAVSGLLLFSALPLAAASSELTDKGYQLEHMVVFSRHNLRTSIVQEDSSAASMINHPLPKWNVTRGYLTQKGGINETILGQYFHLYLVDEGFMSDSWQPDEGEVDFYANSFQRTIATARYFSTGLLPDTNVTIRYTTEAGGDKVFFKPFVLDTTKLYNWGMEYHNQNFEAYKGEFDRNYYSFAKATDFKNSPYAKMHGIDRVDTADLSLKMLGDDENIVSYDGTARNAYQALDAVIMNYFEEPDDHKADWGTGLTAQDWKNIGAIGTRGIEMVVGNPAVALRHSHDILDIIQDDLENDRLKFAFLCGHDTNIFTILTALETEEYTLPGTILTKAPLGVKIVFEKRRNAQGDLFINPYLAYASDNQLRNSRQLSLRYPPMIYHLSFRGLTKNDDGLYRYEDIMDHLNKISHKYEEYCLK
ncbi:Glucose-1-phosphatase precursor [Anaerovibrio sp. JC8]|uniref:histidine-type phosphatase n=1 Tax=Anaerovibrio sp. JC8 TaxID=1240085 RepID=UPI000A09A5AE|nr:histidine-type phosphatase [Anaerovibrio sp. JC8]ORT99357.1 Glucose-1-phosphatase precursor [Anaerovibrio sp. JC8]